MNRSDSTVTVTWCIVWPHPSHSGTGIQVPVQLGQPPTWSLYGRVGLDKSHHFARWSLTGQTHSHHRLSLSTTHQTDTKCLFVSNSVWGTVLPWIKKEELIQITDDNATRMKTLIDSNKLFLLFRMFIHLNFSNTGMCRHAQMFPKSMSTWRDQPRIWKSKEKSAAVCMEYLFILNLPFSLTEN